jgi:hypothetical protein
MVGGACLFTVRPVSVSPILHRDERNDAGHDECGHESRNRKQQRMVGEDGDVADVGLRRYACADG